MRGSTTNRTGWVLVTALAAGLAGCAGRRVAAPADDAPLARDAEETERRLDGDAVLVRWPSCGGRPCAAPAAAPARPERTEVTLAVPIWIPSVSGTFASGDSEVSGGGDVLDDVADYAADLRFGFLGALDVRRGRFGVHAEAFAASWSNDLEFDRGTATLGDAWAFIGRLDARWALLRECPRWDCAPGTRLDVLAGTRTYAVGYRIDDDLGDASERADWWDPIVGLSGNLDLSPRWSLLGDVDVGGFGAGSEFAVWASLGTEYRISRLFALRAGWNFLDLDFERGSGADRRQVDVRLNGPYLALVLRL
jgi:hypothetical protein